MAEFRPVAPEEVTSGPILENILKSDAIDLYRFPTPKWHENDGGRYIGTGTAISDLPGSVKIPLGTLPQRLDELPPQEDIVVYCRTGGRSGNAVQFLRQKGFDRVLNLAGGINRWAEIVDPTMSRY